MCYIPEGSISICNVSAWVRTLHECAERFSGSLMFHIISRHSDVRARVTHVPNRACRSTQRRAVVYLCICGVLSEAGAWLFQSVSEIGYGLTALGIAVWSPKATETFIFSTSSRTAPGSTQTPTQCVPKEGGGGCKGRRVKLTTHSQLRTLRKIGGCVSPLLTRIHAW